MVRYSKNAAATRSSLIDRMTDLRFFVLRSPLDGYFAGYYSTGYFADYISSLGTVCFWLGARETLSIYLSRFLNFGNTYR
jgi:hypothetical protein